MVGAEESGLLDSLKVWNTEYKGSILIFFGPDVRGLSWFWGVHLQKAHVHDLIREWNYIKQYFLFFIKVPYKYA